MIIMTHDHHMILTRDFQHFGHQIQRLIPWPWFNHVDGALGVLGILGPGCWFPGPPGGGQHGAVGLPTCAAAALPDADVQRPNESAGGHGHHGTSAAIRTLVCQTSRRRTVNVERKMGGNLSFLGGESFSVWDDGVMVGRCFFETHHRSIYGASQNSMMGVGGLILVDFPSLTWLVVWNIFPFIGNVIIPTDELIFFRGVGQPPTSYTIIEYTWRCWSMRPTMRSFFRLNPPELGRGCFGVQIYDGGDLEPGLRFVDVFGGLMSWNWSVVWNIWIMSCFYIYWE